MEVEEDESFSQFFFLFFFLVDVRHKTIKISLGEVGKTFPFVVI